MASEYGFHGVTPLPKIHKAPADEHGGTPIPRLSALAEANRQANARIYFREDGIPHPSAVDSEEQGRVIRLGILREAGILIGWTAGRGYVIATPALDTIIQLVAERDDLRQRLLRIGMQSALSAELIASVLGDEDEAS
jgi:hypothetical protein